jgi:hypothetical protein
MIDMNHKYQTRDGRAVEILRTNVKNVNFPIVGIITERNGYETQDRWAADGCYYGNSESEHDLIPVPTKHEGWGVIIKSGSESAGIAGQINLWLTSTREDTEYKIRQRPEANWHLAHVTWED